MRVLGCQIPSACCSSSPERTVALLAFEDVRSSPVADLMDIAQRQKTASELNAAVLASQAQVMHIHDVHVTSELQQAGVSHCSA